MVGRLVRRQIGDVDKWSSESAEMADRVFEFKGWKGPEMVIDGKNRWALHYLLLLEMPSDTR